MRTFTLSFIIFLSIGFTTNAQSINDSLPRRWKWERSVKTELVLGYNWQADWRDEQDSKTRGYIEVGVGRSIHSSGRHGSAVGGIYASEEIHFGSNNIYGTKLGAYTHFFLFDLGLAMVYYTDFKKGNFKLRPEMGFGMGPVRAVFGFNVPTIDNKAFEELSRHRAQVTVQVMVPLHKKILKTN
ncbi:MAG TPA: hypothetical protein VHM26_18895 [Chitinophagaceae bacterium]|jgi:hypothetical protein|nr:hypothetical protein [Chitinophagaceae bacterium]